MEIMDSIRVCLDDAFRIFDHELVDRFLRLDRIFFWSVFEEGIYETTLCQRIAFRGVRSFDGATIILAEGSIRFQ